MSTVEYWFIEPLVNFIVDVTKPNCGGTSRRSLWRKLHQKLLEFRSALSTWIESRLKMEVGLQCFAFVWSGILELQDQVCNNYRIRGPVTNLGVT